MARILSGEFYYWRLKRSQAKNEGAAASVKTQKPQPEMKKRYATMLDKAAQSRQEAAKTAAAAEGPPKLAA